MSQIRVFDWTGSGRPGEKNQHTHGIRVNRNLKTNKLDFYDMEPEEMIGLANDLLTTALRAMGRRARLAAKGESDA